MLDHFGWTNERHCDCGLFGPWTRTASARCIASWPSGSRAACFGLLLLLLIGSAATCGVGVQYGLKPIVDAMSDGGRDNPEG